MKKFIIWATVFTVSLSLLLFLSLNVRAETADGPDYPSYSSLETYEDFWEYVYFPVMKFYTPDLSQNPYYHPVFYYSDTSYSTARAIAQMTKDIVRAQIEFGQGDYEQGYQDGKDDAITNDFSLKEMIFSIIDAPFRVVREALNFEIFGVEVSSLVLGLLSVVLVIFVIRRIRS